MSRPLIIISGHETPETLNAFEQQVLERCRDEGYDCLLIPHVYHLSESSALWQKLAACLGPRVFLSWLHPRPAEWLLQRHQVATEGLKILALGSFASPASAALAVAEALQDVPTDQANQESPATTECLSDRTRQRWYPVIDGSRCVSCQHCLQFCLFGVYELDAQGKVEVRRPHQCKTGCPACARICPHSAIMFPLHEKEGAIAGAPGQFVIPDAAARRMYYQRTQEPCSVCGRRVGRTLPPPTLNGEGICPECGAPQATESAPSQPPARGTFDDLDDLVDQLDRQMRRSS
jgi:Pyruvate/2-oxoacid:ferredoxin oxidoreductase delta subunit